MSRTAVIDKLRQERDEARDAAIALAEADDFDPTSRAFQELESRSASLDKQIEHLAGLLDRRQAADALDGRLSKVQSRQEQAEPETRESLGEMFVRSDVFQTYPGRGTSSRVDLEVRALPMTTSEWNDVLRVGPQFNVQDPERQDVIIPLTNRIQVGGNAIEYVEYTKTSGGAAVVAEGALKPPAEWGPTVTASTLDNIAVYTQLTRQMLEDAQAVRSYIDGELRREVLRKAEQEAVAAIGAATLPTVTGPAGTGLTGALRAGMAAVQAIGYQPNAFLVHSDDLVDLDLASMSTYRGDPRWGLRPVIDPNATPGTVTIGDFRTAVHHYERSGVSLYISDSHADTFLHNVFTLLAEQRSKTVVVRPGALVTATAGA